jgi:hypothetical protein
LQFSELDEALEARLAQAGTTLEAAIKAGKIYKLDFTFLEAFQGVVNNHVERKEKTEDHGTYKIKTLGKDVWDPIKYSVRKSNRIPRALFRSGLGVVWLGKADEEKEESWRWRLVMFEDRRDVSSWEKLNLRSYVSFMLGLEGKSWVDEEG